MRKQFASSSGLLKLTLRLEFDDTVLHWMGRPEWTVRADLSSTPSGLSFAVAPIRPFDQQELGAMFRPALEQVVLFVMKDTIAALEEQLKDQYTAARVQGWRPFP